MRRTLPALIAVASLALAPGARAAPDQSADAVLQLLHDKGLIAATVQPLKRAGDAAADVVVAALNFLGLPYKRGGNSADEGFDCSGFTRHLFESSFGLVLPRRADQQAHDAGLTPVVKQELQPGDLVFFNTMRRAFSHVGIYIGEGKFIHSPRTGAQVRIESLHEGYWVKRFNGARRVEVAEAPPQSLQP